MQIRPHTVLKFQSSLFWHIIHVSICIFSKVTMHNVIIVKLSPAHDNKWSTYMYLAQFVYLKQEASPRTRDINFTECILPWSLTFCFTVMVYLSSTVCHVYYRYWHQWWLQVGHFLIWSSWHFWGYMYIPHWNHTFRSIVNHQAIWNSFPDITQIKLIMASRNWLT